MKTRRTLICMLLMAFVVTFLISVSEGRAETTKRSVTINGETMDLQTAPEDLITSVKMSNYFGVVGNDANGYIKPLSGSIGYELFFSDPSGSIHEVQTELIQNNEYYEFSFPLDQDGVWTLEAVKAGFADGVVYYDGIAIGISLNCVESLAEIYGTADFVLDGQDLPDNANINQEQLLKAISQVRGYDALGNPLEVKVVISGKHYKNTCLILNDGLSVTYTSLRDTYPPAGTYDLEFSLGHGEILSKTIHIVSKPLSAKQLSLSGSLEAGISTDSEVDNIERLAGENRTSTAVKISQEAFLSAHSAVLVNGYDFPDAASAVSLAVELDAPILFVDKDYLDGCTYEELVRLGVKNIYVIGGEKAISNDLLDTLRLENFAVKRIAGDNRSETAIQTAKELREMNMKDTAILVNEYDFPDALSAGPYSGLQAYPFLYTTKDALDTSTKTFLSRSGFKSVIVMGGTDVISESVVRELQSIGLTVNRISGEDRYYTSNIFAQTYFPKAETIVIASGENFPDAMAGSPLAATLSAPILLTYQNQLPEALSAALADKNAQWAYLLGGEIVLSPDVMASLKGLIISPESNDETNANTPTKPPKLIPVLNPDGITYKKAKPTNITPRKPTLEAPIRILLDPGHVYGENPSSYFDYVEGNAMYHYAYTLKAALEKYGFYVDVTRKDIEMEKLNVSPYGYVEGLTLLDRGNMGAGFDLLLSLHSNANANSTIRGSEIYDNVTTPRKDLADLLVKTISETFGHNNRGTVHRILDNNRSPDYGQNWYGILRYAQATHSMIVVHGFHSNQEDTSLLLDQNFLNALAEAEAKALANYYGMPVE